mgnify:CR=1 FL=1
MSEQIETITISTAEYLDLIEARKQLEIIRFCVDENKYSEFNIFLNKIKDENIKYKMCNYSLIEAMSSIDYFLKTNKLVMTKKMIEIFNKINITFPVIWLLVSNDGINYKKQHIVGIKNGLYINVLDEHFKFAKIQ